MIEVMGGRCGYLATAGAIITGAELVFVNEVRRRCMALVKGLPLSDGGHVLITIFQVAISLSSLSESVRLLKAGLGDGKRTSLTIVSEKASKVRRATLIGCARSVAHLLHQTFDTAFLERLYRGESSGSFDVRRAILGHVQQGARCVVWWIVVPRLLLSDDMQSFSSGQVHRNHVGA